MAGDHSAEETGPSAAAELRIAGTARLQPLSVDRITVALIPKASADLQTLQDRTSLSKTDIVNRAIVLYEFIDSSALNGNELLLRNKSTGETRAILIL